MCNPKRQCLLVWKHLKLIEPYLPQVSFLAPTVAFISHFSPHRWSRENLEASVVCPDGGVPLLLQCSWRMFCLFISIYPNSIHVNALWLCSCFCHFQRITQRKGIVALENVCIRRVSNDRSREFCFELYPRPCPNSNTNGVVGTANSNGSLGGGGGGGTINTRKADREGVITTGECPFPPC